MFRLDDDKYVWLEIIASFWVKHIFSLLVFADIDHKTCQQDYWRKSSILHEKMVVVSKHSLTKSSCINAILLCHFCRNSKLWGWVQMFLICQYPEVYFYEKIKNKYLIWSFLSRRENISKVAIFVFFQFVKDYLLYVWHTRFFSDFDLLQKQLGLCHCSHRGSRDRSSVTINYYANTYSC